MHPGSFIETGRPGRVGSVNAERHPAQATLPEGRRRMPQQRHAEPVFTWVNLSGVVVGVALMYFTAFMVKF